MITIDIRTWIVRRPIIQVVNKLSEYYDMDYPNIRLSEQCRELLVKVSWKTYRMHVNVVLPVKQSSLAVLM